MPVARPVRLLLLVGALASLLARATLADEPPAAPGEAVAAASEPISTDRPDFTETPDAVGLGRAQLETGYTFSLREDVQTHDLPEALLRVGLLKDFELRIEWEGWVWQRGGGGPDVDGPADLSLGFKLHLVDQDGFLPSLGILAATSLPVGDPPSGEDDFVPEGKLAWSYELSDPFTLSGNLNLAAAIADSGDRYPEIGVSVSLGISLSERIGMYVEYFGAYGAGQGVLPQNSVNTGLTYLLANDMQLDVRVGAGLSDAADDFFAGAGFSIRF